MKSGVNTQARWLVSVAGVLIILVFSVWSTSATLASGTSGKSAGQTVATAKATITAAASAHPEQSKSGSPAQVAGDSCGVNSNYTVASAGGGTVTGSTTRIANSQCDNCSVSIDLPFSVQLYDQTFATVRASSKGVLSFGGQWVDPLGSCLPAPGVSYAIFPLSQDLSTVGTGRGIYTAVSGTAPNRTFVVQWKVCAQIDEGICGSTFTFDTRLYEGQRKFDVVYGSGVFSDGATVGVQRDSTVYTEYQCATGGNIGAGTVLTFSQPACPTSTPTPTVTNTSTSTATKTATATSTAFPSCGAYLRTVSSPNVAGDNVIYMEDVAIVSPDDVWALGDTGNRVWAQRLQVLHWDGTAWSAATTPSYNAPQIFPRSISASASNDVWVAGGISGSPYSFLMRWDGTQWNQVQLPAALTQLYPNLYSVKALAPDNVWAVGNAYANNQHQTLVIHWDGVAWSRITSPTIGTSYNYLNEITGVSANDLWAVGRYEFQQGDNLPIILHWNGTQWSQVNSPISGREGDLYTVDAASANDVWAVGIYLDDFSDHILTMHWNGTQWSQVESPYPANGYGIYPRSIAAVAPNEAWLVGNYWSQAPGEDPYNRSMVQRWNGSSWSFVTTPDPSNQSDGLIAVDAVAPGEAWAVGYYAEYVGSTYVDRTLTMHYSDPCVTPTATATSTSTSTRTATPTATATATRTTTVIASSTPTSTSISTSTASSTGTVEVVPSATRTATQAVPSSTSTYTATRTATATQPVSGDTGTATATSTQVPPTATRTATQTVPGSTSTGTSTSTSTAAPVPPTATNTTIVANTATATATATRVPATATPQGQPSECLLQFPDVPEGSAFYSYVRCLACQGILGGFSDGTFGPSKLITRGQIAKIVSNAAGFSDTPSIQLFADVAPDSSFYAFIYRLSMPGRAFMSGYPCGGAGEPCGPGNLPYFRPGANATRGQLSKIVANAAGFNETPAQQSFQDVPTTSAFYSFIERLSSRGYISGYTCGATSGEPCADSNLPYFRPNSSVTRGQAAKIVSNTFFPNCDTK